MGAPEKQHRITASFADGRTQKRYFRKRETAERYGDEVFQRADCIRVEYHTWYWGTWCFGLVSEKGM